MMKNILIALGIILIILSFVCCTDQEKCDNNCKRHYTFEVTYNSGKIDTIDYIPSTSGKTIFTLDEGDLKTAIYDRTLVSYVQSFRVLDIDTLHRKGCFKWRVE